MFKLNLLLVLACLVGINTHASDTQKNILIVFSGVDFITDKTGDKHPTGYWLEEFSTPYQVFARNGFKITFATPKGNKPTVDPQSVAVDNTGKPLYWPSKEALQAANEIMQSSINSATVVSLESLTEKDFKNFDAVFFPGGHAPTEDLATDLNVGRLLRYFHEKRKTTALICHAPVALLSTGKGSKFLYKGYKMTAYSNSEESQTPISKYLRYTPEDALISVGAKYQKGADWTSFVVEDRELITGQNPSSSEAIANAVVKRITTTKPSRRTAMINSPTIVGKIPLWDGLSLKIEKDGGTVQGNLTDVSRIKKSLVSKIKSGQFVSLNKDTGLRPHQLTDVLGKGMSLANDSGAIFTFFIGVARNKGSRFEMYDGIHDNFLSALLTHIKTVNSDIGPVALEGYVVVASQQYEIAVMKWKNSESKANAFTNHATRTNPQISVLFNPELSLANGWEDPMTMPESVLSRFVRDMSTTATSGKLAFPVTPFSEVKKNLQAEVVYDVFEKPVNWQKGYNTFYVGVRRKDVPRSKFLARMTAHIRIAKKNLGGACLNGYTILVTSDYEVAFGNWKSKETMESCGVSDLNKEISDDGKTLLTNLFWSDIESIPVGYEQQIEDAIANLSN